MNTSLVKRILFCLIALAACLQPAGAQTTLRDTMPVVDYSRSPRDYVLGDITVSGAGSYDDFLLIGLSGLQKGQKISIPGDEITAAIRRFWKHGLFSDVQIRVDSIVNDSAFLHIALSQRPRIGEIRYHGVKKGEREDLEGKLGLVKGNQLTPNTIDRAKILAGRYFDEKGYQNAEITIRQTDDPAQPGQAIVDVVIDKKSKVTVNHIYITGNENLTEKKIKGGLLKKNVMKLYEKRNIGSWFHSKKFTDVKYKEAKENLVAKYGELGYRDAIILADSVVPHNDKSVDVYINVEEGQRYYLRNINWVGNTVFSTDQLNYELRMKKGDVYDLTKLDERLKNDEDAVGNLYYNAGYIVYFDLERVETAVEGDSVDLEIRITEGKPSHISHVRIFGNDRVYEHVVRRELRNKPGDLFNRDALVRSVREIASMGNFDAESINPDIKPNYSDGTVDVNWALTPKSSDQIEFSLGYGQTGVIGKIGLRFANFSIANLFNKEGLRRGVMPQGNGESFSVSGQTNGRYYQAYSVSYNNPWFGGKRPNSLSVNAFYSKQTDLSENYYNSAYYNNYYNSYLPGYGSNGGYGNYYENFYDPDKYIKIFGASVGWGKRLRWPDDYFTFSADLSYTRYMLKEWSYFMVSNGSCNNLALNLAFSRSSTDNPYYPRTGSDFSLTASITPPYSLLDNKDYEGLANNPQASTYQKELQEKYRWIEYHKWKFRGRMFVPLSKGPKSLVLMARLEFGLLGHYNSHKRSPFETFMVGGDGTSGYSSTYGTETIALRGYDNGSLTPGSYLGYAYDRMTLEIRYPLMLGSSTNIYALAFAEAGNAWNNIKKFNPFDMKRSAGVGVRIFLPMVGLLGVDWAYGFDDVYGSSKYGGSQFHFVLGQEF